LDTFSIGQEQKKASSLYQVFVRSGIKAESPLKAVKGQLFLPTLTLNLPKPLIYQQIKK
jgi:hypothetical protein